jgi:PAS domain S-box-containing protein
MTSGSGQGQNGATAAGEDEPTELVRLRTLLEYSLEVISLLDATGRILYRSPARVRPLGYEDGMVGGNVFEYIHADDQARIATLFGQVVTQPGAVASEVFRVRHADGSYRWLQATTTNLLEEANVRAMVVAYRDVTDQKRAEEEAQRAATLASAASLAAALGHEVSNPLTALTLNLEASLRELSSNNPEEARLTLMTALDSARRIGAIAAGLRVLVQGKNITPEPVDLGVVLERALAHTSYLSGPPVKLCEPVPALHVLGEESNLVTMFANLLANAREAEPFGLNGKEINLRVAVEKNDRVLIELEDHGSGIAEEHVSRICEPFFTTKRQQGQSGLGLAVVQRIVEQFGGSLAISSRVGAGTTVRVWLRRADPTTPRAVEPALNPGARLRGRVLVVDDDPLVLRSLVKLFKLDHDVVGARNGQEALDLVQAGETFDVILCDVLMPGMSGIELHAELERRDPQLAEAVVFITGGGSKEIEDFLQRSGRLFMNKPPDSSRLRAFVNEGVRRARQRAATT